MFGAVARWIRSGDEGDCGTDRCLGTEHPASADRDQRDRCESAGDFEGHRSLLWLVGRVGRFALQADLAAAVNDNPKRQRLFCTIVRPVISNKQPSISLQGCAGSVVGNWREITVRCAADSQQF